MWRPNTWAWHKSSAAKKALNESLLYLNSPETELGRWLRSKKAVQKINSILFVHGGLSPEVLEYDLSLEAIYKLLMKEIEQNYYSEPSGNKEVDFLLGKKGPLWYRGLVMEYNYPKASQEELEKVLSYYQASHIVVGHSVVDSISTDYNEKLVRIDVKHSQEKGSGKSHALLIEDKAFYRTNDLGVKTKIR